jgi:hypothetical protein
MVHLFGVANVDANKEVNICVATGWKWSFCLSSFLQDSTTEATGLPILPILKISNKTTFDVWFYVLMKTSSKCLCFSIIKIMACLLSLLSLQRGFKFGSCAIELSVRSKTSRDA